MGFRLTRFVVDTGALLTGTQQLDEDFFLVPDDRVVVHGTVRFPDGTPAPCAVVKFFKVVSGNPGTTCDLDPIGHAITDDCGQFLLGPLPPDAQVVIKVFFLAANAVMGTATPIVGTCTPIDP
ncbi:MAG: hypothetical protein K6T80_04660 [Firmicutes bacterium]|nr:hypothetical protein [Bacillota bacterium]